MAWFLQILPFGWIFPCILCQYNANPAYSGYAVAAPNAYQQQQPYPTASNSYPTVPGQYPGAAPYPQNTYPTNVYAGQTQAYYPSSDPTIPTMFPQYPSIYPQNPQTTYSNPNDPKCPDGWKKDGNCKTTGICVDRKEHCFYGAICCQIDSKIRQKTTKQNPKTGKTETDWCPNYSHKDGTCSGIKFFCADLSEECVKGDCCEKNSNLPSVPTNPTYPGQQPTYPGQTYPGQTYPGQTYPGQQPTYPGQSQTYPTTGNGYSSIAGIDPILLQQACAIGDEQLCVNSVKNNPAMCSDSSISQTCPKSCGLCNSITMG